MKLNEVSYNLEAYDNIISIALIGSYNTENWVKNRSDIDIVILLDKKIGVSYEFKLEDEITPIFQKYFNYEDIHLSFIYMSDFSEELSRAYINSTDKIILNEIKEIDFRLYVNKYIRNNEWLEKLIDSDSEMLRRMK